MCETLEFEDGVVDDAWFRANGAQNPEVAPLAGHKPMGFDEMADIYNHYCVLDAKLTGTFSSKSDNSITAHSVVGLRLDADVVLTSAVTTALCEQPGTSFRSLTPGDASTGMTQIMKKFRASKFFGVRDPNGKTALTAAPAALPAEQAYFHVFVRRGDQEVPFSPVLFQGFITYKIKWSEPKEMVQS